MPVFKFTVIAVGADLQTDKNLEILLGSGCDDATVGRVDDLQYLDFHREAASFGEAVLSAVNAVEKDRRRQCDRREHGRHRQGAASSI